MEKQLREHEGQRIAEPADSEDSEPIEALEAEEDDEIIETLEDDTESNIVQLHPETKFQSAGSGEQQEDVDTTPVTTVEGTTFNANRIAQEITLMKAKLNEGMSVENMRDMLENELQNTEDLIEEMDDDQQVVLHEQVALRETILAKLEYLNAISAEEAAAAK